jgi:hypothetical protein
MNSVGILFASARIALELPFGSLPSFLRVAAFLALLAGFVALIVWLYRVELREVSSRVARTLLGLRIATLTAVFVVAVGGPVIVRELREPVPGRVLVAVDLSDSMRVADPDRPTAEKLRLVRTLRLHDGIVPDEVLDGWIEQVERTGAPEFPPPGTESGVARRAVFNGLIERADTLTRVQAADRILGPDGVDMMRRLTAAHAVEVIGFGQSAIDLPADPDALAAALATPHSPTTAFTDLKLPLARAADPRGREPVVGVVVLTDGRHNWGEPPTALASGLGTRGTPIYPVNLAPRDPPADVAVVAATPAMSTAGRGSTVPVEVRVRVTRRPAGRVELELKFPDGRPPLATTLRHDGKDRTYEYTFRPKLDIPGQHTLTVVAKGEQPDAIPENDRRAVRVNVVDYKPRVLLIDGEARWEFRYLQSALTRSKDPELDVKAVLFRQPRLGFAAEKGDDPLPALKLPADPDALAAFDCVILGDATAEQLPIADRERLERYVADAGGSLIVAAGKRFIPVGLGEIATDADPLRKLLPIRTARGFAPEAGFLPSLTPDGNRAWFLRLGDTPAASRAVWDGFPPNGWAAVGEAKDGAEVLAWVNDPKARPPEAKGFPERTTALFARQNYGLGRVLYVGLDDTWRWRFKTGDEHHHRFWKQAVQWAIADRLLPTANAAGTLRFGTREPTYRGNTDPEFVLRAAESIPPLSPNAAKAVRIVRLADVKGQPEAAAGLVPLASPGDRPRELTARLGSLAPGRYAVEPEVPEWEEYLRGPAGKLRSAFEVFPPDAEETTDLSANLPLLEQLATVSGGRVYDVTNVGDLARELVARAAVREYESSSPLRRSWWTLAVVALLLTVEWVIRKLSGLA